MLLKSFTKGLQALEILWAKVQKQKFFSSTNLEIWLRFSWNWWTLVHRFWHCWKALKKYYKTPKVCGPKFKNKKSYAGSNSDKYSDFLEIGELWPTYLTFLDSPREGLQAPKILWAKVQKQKSYFVDSFWTLVPILSKLVNFGPHMSAFWKALRRVYETPKYCGPKFKNKKVIKSAIFWTLVPIFLKLVNFGPHVLAFVEKPQNVLRSTKILWTKVQKQQSYASKTPKFTIVGNFRGP